MGLGEGKARGGGEGLSTTRQTIGSRPGGNHAGRGRTDGLLGFFLRNE